MHEDLSNRLITEYERCVIRSDQIRSDQIRSHQIRCVVVPVDSMQYRIEGIQ